VEIKNRKTKDNMVKSSDGRDERFGPDARKNMMKKVIDCNLEA
jgi:hypothetical protein